jgi:hypothetical protein
VGSARDLHLRRFRLDSVPADANARDGDVMLRCLGFLLLASSARLLADGGMVLLHKEGPPFAITVFVSPAPPRTGVVDLSILIQANETLDPVLDADVDLILTRNESEMHVRATRDQAQNKLLYAASVHLDDPGEWTFTASVRTPSLQDKAAGAIKLAAGQPEKIQAYRAYFALPFVWLALFAIHQRLARV